MGLLTYIGQMLFAEHAYKPIKGDVGFIGRQTTYLRAVSLEHLSKLYGVTPRSNLKLEMDDSTYAQRDYGGGFITDRYLMKYLGAKSFKSIDVSDYEGADIVFDICAKLPKKLYGSFDFIYDGSCLDNVFDPATAVRNVSRLLRPGGRALLLNHGTWFNGPYTIMSPGWYFDFFAANGYTDCQVFLGFFKTNRELHFGPLHLLYYNWAASTKLGNIPELPPGFQVMMIVLVEKGKKSTDDATPVQHQYRDKKYNETVFTTNPERILRSPRRLFSLPQDLFSVKEPFVTLQVLGGPDISGWRLADGGPPTPQTA